MKSYSTFAIGRMLHVDPGSVANWIDQKRLGAYRTPGGHRRVSRNDLVMFLKSHEIPIPEELVDSRPRVVIACGDDAQADQIASTIATTTPGCEVVKTRDAFMTGSMIASLQPDLAILDAGLPGLDAAAACSAIRKDKRTRHTKVLTIAGDCSGDDQQQMLQAGAMACLSGPLDTRSLMEGLSRCLNDRMR